MVERTFKFHIVTIFPQFFFCPLSTGLFGKAVERGIIKVFLYDVRAYAPPPHHVVDDVPYGGGAGMVMKPGPVAEAIDEIKTKAPDVHIINLSPRGCRLDQKKVEELAEEEELCIICSRYEGIDERIVRHMCHEEISIGDYVLHAGETAALVLIDAISRLQPGFIGRPQSRDIDSFSSKGILSFPQYTRPAEFRGWRVPDVLLSGNHRLIERWRRKQALLTTFLRRPDLLREANLDNEDLELLDEIRRELGHREDSHGHHKGKG